MKKNHLFSILLGATTFLCAVGVGTGNLYQSKTTLARESQTQLKQVKQNKVSHKPVPLDYTRATQFLDIRGVGDSGMALTYKQPLQLTQTLPEGGFADFGKRLDALDPSEKSYRGDLSFINWETVVGQRCNSFRGRPSRSSYAFVSHPANLKKAYNKGFNLIGLANNHSWDCPVGENGKHGALVSSFHMNDLSKQGANWLWHGVGQPNQKASAAVKTMTIKGKPIKVAFASLYMGGACSYISCVSDKNALLRSLRDSNADIRILSIHSWNSATQQQLVNTGREFIRNYKGDIVFGHGPHVWKPVTIVQSNSGKKGVMFESLGNFIHPNLAAKRQDMIGRVLLDLETLKIRQIQAIPLKVNGAKASFAGALSPRSIPARNFTWRSIDDSNWRSGVNSQVKGVYYNLP
ncbi:MAG: CapA family protein [Prochloraceae cyanobacterium]|nr:CapA family protein [Prochloraceae cyanobacterium]